MIQTTFDITIIGAGVVGLAVAEELAGRYGAVLLLDKNPNFGMETSSRHSGVIHAGIYYPPGFLKADLSREGNRLLYEICERRGIPHRKTGKLMTQRSFDISLLNDISPVEKRRYQSTSSDLRYSAGLPA